MTSDDFTDWTAGLFNIGKLIALIVIGVWTLYQWNVSIFPKESYDEFARRASRRADLSISIDNSRITTLDRKQVTATSDISFHRVTIAANCRFSNAKDFPVSLNIVSVSLQQGDAEPLDINKIGTSGKLLVDWQWLSREDVPLGAAFGAIIDNQPVTIEPNGILELPLNFAFWIPWNKDQNYKLIEINIESEIQAVHPSTGSEIADSKKNKQLTFRGIVFREENLFEVPGGSKHLDFGVKG